MGAAFTWIVREAPAAPPVNEDFHALHVVRRSQPHVVRRPFVAEARRDRFVNREVPLIGEGET